MNNIKWTLIYGSPEHTPALMEAARMNALKALPLVAQNCGIIVLDRHGIEAEVMRTCQLWGISLLVVGTTARPSSGVSMKVYERAIIPKGTPQFMRAKLNRYALHKAHGIVILGDSPDCRAMRMYASLLDRTTKHSPALSTVRLVAPDSDWLKENGHYYVSES